MKDGLLLRPVSKVNAMDTTPRNDEARDQAGLEVTAKHSRNKCITKLDRIVNLLKTRPEGLNRFEAASFGDTCLNSTAAVIRSMYGDKLIQRWETVPTRYCSTGVRVLRFWLV